MELRPVDKDRNEIEVFLRRFFEAGKNKDLPSLADFHAPNGLFTKFDENPPYSRQNSDEAFVHEQAAFANISDYNYQIDELRIDIIGETGIATFNLSYTGMFVNDYSFEGSPVSGRVRATMVITRTNEGWKIAHEHLSRYPDWAPKGSTKT